MFVVRLRNTGTDENNILILIHVEKIRAAKMLVSIRLTGVNARRVDSKGDFRRHQIVAFRGDRAVIFTETPPHEGNHHVFNLKSDDGMRRV
jgi:hypothetical protein